MSPHRTFQDDDDVTWTAWDVIPSWGERRVAERRKDTAGPPAGFRERRARERRVTHGIRIGLAPRLAGGWLAFDSPNARRRLVPIPPDWHTLDERDLRKLLGSAEKLAAKRRRLIE